MPKSRFLLALSIAAAVLFGASSDTPASPGSVGMAATHPWLGVAYSSPDNAAVPPVPPARIRYAQATPPQAPEQIGSVATVQGSATVTRNGASTALKVGDAIFKGDVLQTGSDGALGITFDDETTFNLSANARIEVNEFVYQQGGSNNSALFNVVRGTVAFVASQVAKTGDMKITTPTATLGIRGTTGVIEVPENLAADPNAQVAVKLYADSTGTVGRIEVFALTGARLGILNRVSTGFGIRPGAGGRIAAVALRISAQEAARDRVFVRQLFTTHNLGRQMIIQRRNLRLPNLKGPNLQKGPNLLKGPKGPNLTKQPNLNLKQAPKEKSLPKKKGPLNLKNLPNLFR